MRTLKYTSKVVFVATSSGANCPRISVNRTNAKFRDDYHNVKQVRNSVLRKIFA